MSMTSKELVRLLKKNGWFEVKQEGSHLRLRKERICRYRCSNAQQRFSQRLTEKIIKTGRA